MNKLQILQLINDLEDLHKQATVERSHFYVGSTVNRSIIALREYLQTKGDK